MKSSLEITILKKCHLSFTVMLRWSLSPQKSKESLLLGPKLHGLANNTIHSTLHAHYCHDSRQHSITEILHRASSVRKKPR